MREVIIAAPSGYANATLNGARALVLHENTDPRQPITTALIVSGPETGRAWQFCPAHLADATPTPPARGPEGAP